VRVTIQLNGQHYHGRGVSTDIIEAAAHAYLKALNKADLDRQRAMETPVVNPLPHV
jgi:2-isopropylmalate synthase